MKIAIMQPYFFPYLGYWQLINAVDRFVLLDDVNFIKKGWIHRNNILINNEAKQINLSIVKASQNKLIKDLFLLEDDEWGKRILNQITSNYSKAPYYKTIYEIIENEIFISELNLTKFLSNSIRSLMNYMQIKTDLIPSSSIYEKGNLTGQSRIIDICIKESASIYVNAFGGRDLYDNDVFKSNSIDLKFIQMNDIFYSQLSTEFIPNLSIIDVLMNNSLGDVKKMLLNYKLIK